MDSRQSIISEDSMNEKTVRQPTILQHGPGPPPNSVTEPSQSGFEQLQLELRRCMGKLRGYETLNLLYQESVQNCSRYKQQTEELARQIDSLTRHNSAMVDVDPAAVASAPAVDSHALPSVSDNEHVNESESAHQSSSSNTILRLSKIAIACCESSMPHRPSDIPELLPTSSACKNQFSLEEFGANSSPTRTRPQQKTPESSCTSSSSFVQVNSPETDASTSLQTSAAGVGSANQKKPTVNYGSFDAKSSSIDMSPEINRLIEIAKNIGSNRNISLEDLAGDLIKAGVGVMTIQKQARIQQVMLNQMTAEIAELKAEIAAKQDTITKLEKDRNSLRDTVRRMETAGAQKAHAHLSETGNTRDQINQDIHSIEWVEVERQHTSGTTVEGDTNETAVTAVPMIEAELRRRVEKLNATVNELVSVNRSWDEHCRQLQSNHNQQITAMQQKIDDLQYRQEEYERTDQQKQLEFESILLNSKKRLETEELAKEDALHQLHIERQQRMESEQNCVDLSRKAAQLEQRILQLQQSNQGAPKQSLQFDPVVQSSSVKEQELLTQLSILQAQVNVYKEDFDNERRDREKAKTTIESLRKRVIETEIHTRRVQTELTQANEELKQTKSQCETWRQRFKKLSSDLATLQQQVRPREVTRENSNSANTFRHSLPQLIPRLLATARTRKCEQCTFENPSVRTSCEMCGGILGSYLESDSASVTGSGSVAGLQILRPAMPYNPANSRDFERDEIDQRQ